MDPSQCTLVILSPSNYTTLAYPYIDNLQAVFGHVMIADDSDYTVLEQKHHHSTLFFMDADIIQDHDDQNSVSSSSSSNTTIMDHRLTWIKKMTQHFIHHPMIVCSSDTSSTFMLDCLHAGAADYLVKPLHLPVIQTLFLKLYHRQGPEPPTPRSASSTSSLSSSITTTASANATILDISTTATATNTASLQEDDFYFLPPTIQPEDMNHRFKEIVTKDIQLTKAMMDIYAPPLPTPTKYIPLSSRQADDLKLKLACWDFSPFEFNHDELIHCVYLIFEMTLSEPELSHLTVSQDQLYDFIIDLANAYHGDNPYHNFAHAVDVLQCLYYFLCELGILTKHDNGDHRSTQAVSHTQPPLQTKHAFALLLSGIGHDAGHPGVNNMFLINSRTPLAVMYNDRSVLESLHSMTLFQLIKKHGLDQWWAGDDEYQCFRQIIISSILATDMALNNDYVKKFKQAANGGEPMDYTLLCTALIKCADVSNVTRPFRRGKLWAELLVEEFASQGDLERELGMSVLAANDRTKIILEDCQIGFIRFVALDLFSSVAELLPELAFTVKQMKQNLQQWELEKKRHQQPLGMDVLPTTITTAGTKRRLSYCLEASTPPSLNAPPLRAAESPTTASFASHHHHHHHYLNPSSLAKKKPTLEKHQLLTPASPPPTSSSSFSCIIQ